MAQEDSTRCGSAVAVVTPRWGNSPPDERQGRAARLAARAPRKTLDKERKRRIYWIRSRPSREASSKAGEGGSRSRLRGSRRLAEPLLYLCRSCTAIDRSLPPGRDLLLRSAVAGQRRWVIVVGESRTVKRRGGGGKIGTRSLACLGFSRFIFRTGLTVRDRTLGDLQIFSCGLRRADFSRSITTDRG